MLPLEKREEVSYPLCPQPLLPRRQSPHDNEASGLADANASDEADSLRRHSSRRPSRGNRRPPPRGLADPALGETVKVAERGGLYETFGLGKPGLFPLPPIAERASTTASRR